MVDQPDLFHHRGDLLFSPGDFVLHFSHQGFGVFRFGEETDVVLPNLDVAFDLADLVVQPVALLVQPPAAALLYLGYFIPEIADMAFAFFASELFEKTVHDFAIFGLYGLFFRIGTKPISAHLRW